MGMAIPIHHTIFHTTYIPNSLYIPHAQTLFLHQSLKILLCTKMGLRKISLAFVFLMGLTLVHLTLAQDSKEDYLNAHNAARADVGVPSLTWDDTVAAYAQNYANQRIGDCNLVHSGGKYGENIAWGSADLSGTDAVKMWVDEKANYDYNSNSCVGGQCGHYTQVVWRNSVRLGCAKVRCNNGGTFIGCNYDPPGNYNNERPY